MTDRQAAAARKLSNSTFYAIVNAVTSRWSQVGSDPRGRIVDEDGLREEISRVVTREASVRLAQAERALRLDDELEMERNTLRARLREYEEALSGLGDVFGWIEGNYPAALIAMPSVLFRRIGAAGKTLAASGGREAP